MSRVFLVKLGYYQLRDSIFQVLDYNEFGVIVRPLKGFKADVRTITMPQYVVNKHYDEMILLDSKLAKLLYD